MSGSTRVCALAVTVVFLLGFALAFAIPVFGQPRKTSPLRIMKESLDAERLSIYRAVIGSWENHGHGMVRLSNQTYPLDVGDCETKDLDLENADPLVVHRFHKPDLSKLGRDNLSLVDPVKQLSKVAKNDPQKTTRAGKSVDEALRNSFAVEMTSVSEIRFDRKHEHAVVTWRFVCGTVCGSGAGAVMEKEDGEWRFSEHGCSIWMAKFDPILRGSFSPGT